MKPEPAFPSSHAASRSEYDAVVVGSGPNGLAAGITLARASLSVLLVEAADEVGGGMRSHEGTRPGFVHDHCSTIHALGVASAFFRSLPLEEHGLRWRHPDAPCAHPLPDGSVGVAERDLEATCAGLGIDGDAHRRLFGPLVARFDELLDHNLGPFRLPRHPLLMARFGLSAVRSAVGLARARYRSEPARALFAGMAAHSILPLDAPLTSAIGLMLGASAHHRGWPVAEGGSRRLAETLAVLFTRAGGEIVLGQRVESLDALPRAGAVLFDTSPGALSRIAGDTVPERFHRALRRFRHGPGAFKLDWALDGPIPWRNPECARAGTVHLGGTLEQVAAAERAPWEGRAAEQPFVLLTQPSIFDPTRAPPGCHVGWAYCHVPPGCTEDRTEAIEGTVEAYAPGFRDRILARHVTSPAAFEADNPNCVGGDITGGVMDARQLFTRPTVRWNPYTTPNPRLFLCSASTPPGGGVHGMCGVFAARAALARRFPDAAREGPPPGA